MHYLFLDEDGYLLGYTHEPPEGRDLKNIPTLDVLPEFELEDIFRLRSYRWDGEKLVQDDARRAKLIAEDKTYTTGSELPSSQTDIVQEVQYALMTAQINTLVVDDTTALRWRTLYPDWETGVAYKANDKVQFGDSLYKCIQAHTAQANWAPDLAASLWTEICESHSGTKDDPVPYNRNMELVNGLYYIENGVVYRCFRSTGIPVYNSLADLVGIYVEKNS